MLLPSRPEGHRAACEKIQRLFRDYQGRQQRIKKRQIAWEVRTGNRFSSFFHIWRSRVAAAVV